MQFVDPLSGLVYFVLLPGAGVSPVLQVQKSSPIQHSGLTCLAWYDSWKNTENRWLLDLALVSHNDESKHLKDKKALNVQLQKTVYRNVGHIKRQIPKDWKIKSKCTFNIFINIKRLLILGQ